MAGIENPILLDLPVPIRTKRLVLRPIAPGNGGAMNEAISESLPELAPWLDWATSAPTPEQSEELARTFAANFILRSALVFLMWREDRLIGRCALYDFNWKIPSAELGYWIRTSESGKGYMTESISALAIYAFRHIGLRRLVLGCFDENLKSTAIAQRLGFTLESRAACASYNSSSKSLCTWRTYVRLNADGLDDAGVSWGA